MYGRFSEETLPISSFTAREPAARLLNESLPLNLEEWFDWEVLVGWVEEEIQELDWDHPLVQEHLHRHPEFRPRALLKIAACGYATQVFSTKDLIARCRSEARYLEICEGKLPFAHEVTTFRRKNRKLIVKVLTGLFTRAFRRRYELCLEPGAAEVGRMMADRAQARLDIARHMDVGDDD